VKNREVAAP